MEIFPVQTPNFRKLPRHAKDADPLRYCTGLRVQKLGVVHVLSVPETLGAHDLLQFGVTSIQGPDFTLRGPQGLKSTLVATTNLADP